MTVIQFLEKWDPIWEPLALLVLIGGFVYTAIQVHLLRQGQRGNHDWNRRKAAQDITTAFNERVHQPELLEKLLQYNERKKPIPADDLLAAFKASPSLGLTVHTLLNYYEALARGINQQIFDEKVIKAAKRSVMIRTFRLFEPYIKQRRLFTSDAWSELEGMVVTWEEEDRSDRNTTG